LLPEWSAIVALLLLLWSGISVTLWQQREFALTAAAQHATNIAKVFEETSRRIVTGIDETLLDLRGEYSTSGNILDLPHWQTMRHRSIDYDGFLAVTDTHGRILAASQTPIATWVTDRAYFRVHQNTPDDTLYISPPFVGRESAELMVVFSRKWFDKHGQFAGVVCFSVHPKLLSEAFQVEDFPGGFVSVIGEDGIIRAHYPFEKVGENISTYVNRAISPKQQEATVLTHQSKDGVERVVSFRRAGNTGLIVEVGYRRKQVLASFYRWRTITIVVGVLVSAAVLWLGKRWLAQRMGALRSQTALAETLRSISQGVAMFEPDGRLSLVNARASAWLGMLGDAAGGAPEQQEVVQPDGAVIEVRRHATPSGGDVFTFTDITAYKQAEARITALAMRDPLTGLANRRQFHQHLAGAIAQHGESNRTFALLHVNIDHFKEVNDSYGHEYADRLLKAVADRLLESIDVFDILARLGSDEFAILQEAADPDSAEWFAHSLRDAFKNGIITDEQSAMLSISVGVACFPRDGEEASQLLKKAGIALSRAKAEGRGEVRLFEAEMEHHLLMRRTLQIDLREAIASGELSLAFQPQFNAQSLALVGFEALARWDHPTLGRIAPDLFIRIAEEAGMIEALGDQILHRACAHANAWPRPLRVGVNLSPLQFRGYHLPNQVEAVLWETKLDCARLELEVTEGLLIREQKHAESILSALSALGVRLALDDFGTGYSSLSYLRQFRFDTLKIDKSFVQTLVEDKGSRAILEAILAMAHGLGLDVIAEGVETEAQLQILRADGCTELQGYLLGRPIPSEDVPALIAGSVSLAS
jgi:diguanylate cyclase (GGDEF)-like protein